MSNVSKLTIELCNEETSQNAHHPRDVLPALKFDANL